MKTSPSEATSFWLGTTDALPLALYRAGFGALLVGEALERLPYATELFSSEGYHSSRFHVFVPPPAAAVVLVLASALSAGALALGWRTRASALATLFTWGWLFAIDQINEKSLHTIQLVVLAMLALSDCGAVRSLDARGLRGNDDVYVWATPQRLLQLQFVQVYFFAGVAKLFAPGWVAGDVLARSMHSRWATELGLWVGTAMPQRGWRVLALVSVLYELLAPWLLFVPWARRYVIAVGLSFHLGIEATLGIGWLGRHFILALVLLYPDSSEVRRVFRWIETRLRRRAISS
jgi:hypothetical protein